MQGLITQVGATKKMSNTAASNVASRQRRSNHRLGSAPETLRGDGKAIRLYNAYRNHRGKPPFDEMLYIEIEEDNLENEIAEICEF